MALQIGGTTVVDNSRNIVNVGTGGITFSDGTVQSTAGNIQAGPSLVFANPSPSSQTFAFTGIPALAREIVFVADIAYSSGPARVGVFLRDYNLNLITTNVLRSRTTFSGSLAVLLHQNTTNLIETVDTWQPDRVVVRIYRTGQTYIFETFSSNSSSIYITNGKFTLDSTSVYPQRLDFQPDTSSTVNAQIFWSF